MTTQFDTFINTNKIKLHDIPEPIREKINIFKSISAESGAVTEKDWDLMEQRLKQLDDEIYDDLLNFFDDLLDNNEVKRKPQPFKSGDNIEVIGGNPKFLGDLFKVLMYYPSSKREPESVLLDTNGKSLSSFLMSTKHVKKTSKRTHEDVLEELYSSGKKIDNLSKSKLKSLGLHLDFSQWEIPVGKFCLYRKSILSLHFRLDKK